MTDRPDSSTAAGDDADASEHPRAPEQSVVERAGGPDARSATTSRPPSAPPDASPPPHPDVDPDPEVQSDPSIRAVTDPVSGVPASLVAELARPAHDMLMIATRPDGVIALQGPPTAVEKFTERIERVLGSPRLAQATQYASMLGAGVDALPGVGENEPQVYQFSQRAMDLLRRNGIISGQDGVFGAAADAVTNSASGGIPDWLPLPSGADVIQLQTAAVGLALHASIKGLADAVERVENRVDELRDLVRSGQVGEVLGHHRVITERLRMIDGTDSRGLGETDWAAVAHLHPHIVSGLERTRFFIRSRMGLTEPGRMVRSRVDAAERLIDANLADALGLLGTCEHNLAGWQRLRLDRVVRNEPAHLESVLVDMESSLALHRAEDQALVDDLIRMIDGLMEPTGLEGLEMVNRRRLIRHVEEIHAATATFARQRDLDLPEMANAALPGFRASTSYVAGRTRDGGRWAYDRVKRGGGAARRVLPGGGRKDPGHEDNGAIGHGLAGTPPPPDPSQRSPID